MNTRVIVMVLLSSLVGLCLIEVLSGKEVFSDIPVDKTVQAMKADGQKPTMPVRQIKYAFLYFERGKNPRKALGRKLRLRTTSKYDDIFIVF